MSISFTCPHCQTINEAADAKAGQPIDCVRCGKSFLPPSAAGPVDEPEPRDTTARSTWATLALVGVVILGCSGVVFMMLPAVNSNPGPSRKGVCKNNLKSIAFAMHTYHVVNKCFPPAYIPDENGKPMHSWRVLLLPYIEEDALYKQYDFNEPWNGPNNIRLADKMVALYRCPSQTTKATRHETSYVMVVGPGMVTDGPTARKLGDGDITDGTSATIMLVEVANSGIPWSEPRDLDAAHLAFKVNDTDGRGIGGNHSGGANVAFCDGHTKFISSSISPEKLQALCTIAGGEDVSDIEKGR